MKKILSITVLLFFVYSVKVFLFNWGLILILFFLLFRLLASLKNEDLVWSFPLSGVFKVYTNLSVLN